LLGDADAFPALIRHSSQVFTWPSSLKEK